MKYVVKFLPAGLAAEQSEPDESKALMVRESDRETFFATMPLQGDNVLLPSKSGAGELQGFEAFTVTGRLFTYGASRAVMYVVVESAEPAPD